MKEGKPWGKKIKDDEMLDRLKLFLCSLWATTTHLNLILNDAY
jgi:hypothetical protein